MRGSAALPALLLAATMAAACSAGSTAPAQTPAQLVVAPGQQFSVSLDGNRSTGFQWELGKPLDAAVLTLVDTRYEQAPNPSPGEGGTEVWTFAAVAPGWAKIQLLYRRPWEDMAPARIVVYSVDVR